MEKKLKDHTETDIRKAAAALMFHNIKKIIKKERFIVFQFEPEAATTIEKYNLGLIGGNLKEFANKMDQLRDVIMAYRRELQGRNG
jgi:hypothetical protein